ncbi:sporulation-specific protein 22 [Vermiconidia calcicola]|uniref:Sporulation-specific protein 22 n=1 Tax=Vermiconidia calcicola TaxID=1690605 RepID=A0ACC3MHU6_9PEZI|nr:sporulation-specific protein 22 [Vermiconidia calcicola]
MAPLKPVKKDAFESRVQGILGLAKKILGILNDRQQLPSSVEGELDHAIKRSLPLQVSASLAGQLSALDSVGCDLWNAATKILREEQHEQDIHTKRNDNVRLMVLLRSFAFLLIDSAHRSTSKHSKDQDQRLRNFRVGLKSSRSCLDKDELELALKVLERCAEHVGNAEEASPLVRIATRDDNHSGSSEFDTLTAEYYLLRMMHAWKSQRPDLAEHFFSKFSGCRAANSATLQEKAAQSCYEIGKALSKNKVTESTIKWLERALSALDSCDIEQIGAEAAELRLAISAKFGEYHYGRVYVGLDTNAGQWRIYLLRTQQIQSNMLDSLWRT